MESRSNVEIRFVDGKYFFFTCDKLGFCSFRKRFALKRRVRLLGFASACTTRRLVDIEIEMKMTELAN